MTPVEQGGAVQEPDRGDVLRELAGAIQAEPVRDYVDVPVDAFPRPIAEMIVAGARIQGVSTTFWATPALGVLGGCIGATRRAVVNRTWREPANVWAATVAASGAGKSPAMHALLEPVRERDRQLHERTRALEESSRAAQAGQPRGAAPPPPVPSLAATVSDVTLEALGVRLRDNPRGLVLVADELAGWLRGMDRYRRGGDEQAWLSLHSGAPLVVDRKTAGSLRVEHPGLSVVGAIQPSIAARYLADEERRASGLLARVLLAAPPVTPARLIDEDVPQEVSDGYARAVRSLLDLQLDSDCRPVDLPFTPAAWEMFRPWHDRNGDACASAASRGDEATSAGLSKLRGYAVRIALVFALVEATSDGTAALLESIDEVAMGRALRVVDWFEVEMRRLYGEWNQNVGRDRERARAEKVRRLAERIAAVLNRGPASLDELHTATAKNFTGEELRAALALLAEEGRALPEPPQATGGRPREVWASTNSHANAQGGAQR